MTTDATAQSSELHIGGMAFARPALWPVIITVALVGLCIGLGIWQVQRLHWKQGLLAELDAAKSAPPITMDALPADLNALADENFHFVSLTGEYDHNREYHVIGRAYNGEPGFEVLVPFHLSGGKGTLLVNRGWIPQDKKDPATRMDGAPVEGDVPLYGYVLVPQGGSRFLPDHDVKGNIWFWQDTARIAKESGEALPHLVVQRVDADASREHLPMAKKAFDVELRNDHFAYSIMWFCMALSGLAIFVIYHHQPRNKKP